MFKEMKKLNLEIDHCDELIILKSLNNLIISN